MRTKLIGISAVLVASSITSAQDVPPPEAGTAQFTSRMISGQLEVRDVRNGVAVVVPKDQFFKMFPPEIRTSVDLRSQPTGCDLVITATNTSSSPKEMGHFSVGVLNLGQNIESFDFRATGDPVPLTWSTAVPQGWTYPNDLYSPVFLVRNNTYAVGISMQYPVMEYKHDVMMMVGAGRGSLMEGEGGPGWVCDFGLGHPYNGASQRWAVLQPGQASTYVVSVRITRTPQEWQGTLLPYRDYFRARYGGVKYRRDTTPIRAVSLADPAYLSASDPYGFMPWLRPDLNGWGVVKHDILTTFAGWDTVILWAASGLYRQHPDRNYPYQFTSHWNATTRLSSVFNTTDGLPSVVAAGRKIGLWWGRSAEVATSWDTSSFEPFDPDNPSHVTAAFREMDGAARAGATVIGLDTFMHDLTPVWKAYGWLQQLEQRYPNMKFCTETSSCDIMHTICPTFVPGWQTFASRPSSTDQLIIIKHPNYLADFINPGHETWGQLSYQEQQRWFGSQPSSSQAQRELTNFAAWGYRPVVCDTLGAPPANLNAARSWESSIPAPIRDADAYIANLRAGRLAGEFAEAISTPPTGTPSGGQSPPPPPPPPPPPSASGGPTDPVVLPPSMRRVNSSATKASSSRLYRLSGRPRTTGGTVTPPETPTAESGSNSRPTPAIIFHMPRLRVEQTVGKGIIPHYINRPAPEDPANP